MSDLIKHECGIAMIRLLKPLAYYHKKYDSALYGLNKLNLLMQKQRNRGQDGVGVATIKLNMPPGHRYISRTRYNAAQPIKNIFIHIFRHFEGLSKTQLADVEWLKQEKPYTGELLLGHLRYGTHGDNSLEVCHPLFRQNNWKTRSLLLAGNFNMTNADELFEHLVELGQFPKATTDTVTLLEKIGHFLDEEVQTIFSKYKTKEKSGEIPTITNRQINHLIMQELDIQHILQRSTRKLDGGYVIAGLIGHGDAFVMRDPNGIRPAFYYKDDEVIVVTSERPVIQTAFDIPIAKVHELKPGHALIIKKDGQADEKMIQPPQERKACSFERIYFSRGSDRDIYTERKALGKQLASKILESIDYDLKNTIFSYVPNTAIVSFYGLIQSIDSQVKALQKQQILAIGGDLTSEQLDKILNLRPRVENLIIKDEKSRTFITASKNRKEKVTHGYDVTYGIVRSNRDTIILMDDSIVRGTTMRQSIISIVARLNPKKIIIVSSAPQIRYPDCYGIDMSKMKNFVAFRALVQLLEKTGQTSRLQIAYERCKDQQCLPKELIKNEVKPLYDLFDYETVSSQIAKIVTPEGVDIPVEVIYQTLEGLHVACPNHTGDWYFSGNYPTKGGNKVVNRAFMNYMENNNARPY